MVLKTLQRHIFSLTQLSSFFFSVLLSAYVYVGYFANKKFCGYVIILNDSCQNSAVCRTGARERKSTQHRSVRLVRYQRHILMSCSDTLMSIKDIA